MKKNIKNKLKNKLKKPINLSVESNDNISGENMVDILSGVNTSMLSILGNELFNEINSTLSKGSNIAGKSITKSISMLSGIKNKFMDSILKKSGKGKNKDKIDYNVENLKSLKKIEKNSDLQLASMDEMNSVLRNFSSLNTEQEILSDTSHESYSVLEDIKSILANQLKVQQEGIQDKELGFRDKPKKPEGRERNERDTKWQKRWKNWTQDDLSHNMDYGVVDAVVDSIIAAGVLGAAVAIAIDKIYQQEKKENESSKNVVDAYKKSGVINETQAQQINTIETESGIETTLKNYTEELLNKVLLIPASSIVESFGGDKLNVNLFDAEKTKAESLQAMEGLAKASVELEVLRQQDQTDEILNLISQKEDLIDKYKDIISEGAGEETFLKIAEELKNNNLDWKKTYEKLGLNKEIEDRNKTLLRLNNFIKNYKPLVPPTPEPDIFGGSDIDVTRDSYGIGNFNKSYDNIKNEFIKKLTEPINTPVNDAIIKDDKITPFRPDDVVNIGTNLSGDKNELADIIAKSLQGLTLNSNQDNSSLESIMKDNNMLLRTFLSAIVDSLKNTKGNVLMSQNVNLGASKSTSLSPPKNKFANK